MDGLLYFNLLICFMALVLEVWNLWKDRTYFRYTRLLAILGIGLMVFALFDAIAYNGNDPITLYVRPSITLLLSYIVARNVYYDRR